jgi:cysteine synthase
VVDRKVRVAVDEAYDMCHRIAHAGLFAGQSSGAYLSGVKQVVDEIDRGVVVTVLNDIGERYFSAHLWDEPGQD